MPELQEALNKLKKEINSRRIKSLEIITGEGSHLYYIGDTVNKIVDTSRYGSGSSFHIINKENKLMTRIEGCPVIIDYYTD